MKKYLAFIFVLLQIELSSKAQEKMDYFLPEDVTYNRQIPTPEQFFNQQIGEWHLSYDQVLNYMNEIVQLSDRAVIQEYARSYENRPLVHVIFTSEENQGKLEELKAQHSRFSEPDENIAEEKVPLVVTLGYGIHGNESSATNSSILTAYYLAAAQGDKIDELLSNTIILVDPSLNPDGFTRHGMWANMHQSAIPLLSNDSRQFDEVWPGGRTNHYWFDLNRDYLLLVHPESRGRVEKFYEWKPNIVTDHHEMSANSTFFFQPGVPSRNNPLTPEKNYELTHKIAAYHARFLDKIGSSYFSEERFDDYYFGKGSSYPDVNGSIGILFEQAGFRGRIRNTSNGVRKLAFGIRNHFTVSLSTLQAAIDLKDELLEFQRDFYRNALDMADKDPVKAYVFGSEDDLIKTQYLVDLLERHQINVYKNKKRITAGAKIFNPETSFIVPVRQKQYRLLKSLFEVATNFTDSIFYDVSTWTMPYALNVSFAKIESLKNIEYSNEKVNAQKLEGKVIGGKSNIAYLFRWNEYTAPNALYQLQNAGLQTKVATGKFSFIIDGKNQDFSYGTIQIPANHQHLDKDQIFSLVSSVAKNSGIDFYSVETGLSRSGMDLGSDDFELLSTPQILMLVGDGVSSSDAGEIWHLFDQRYKIPVCLTEWNRINSVNLEKYNSLILPGGSYSGLSDGEIRKIRNWTENGGTLIACKSAAGWAARNNFGHTKYKKDVRIDSIQSLQYSGRQKLRALNSISGAIFNAKLDVSHPLCYGYIQKELPVFKTGRAVAETLKIDYAEPVSFTDNPYISGFVSDLNLEKIKNAPVVSVQKIGRGRLISYYENMTFRGTWLGTNKLFSNAVFFGSVIN